MNTSKELAPAHWNQSKVLHITSAGLRNLEMKEARISMLCRTCSSPGSEGSWSEEMVVQGVEVDRVAL